jgi:hypothetical protein
MYVYLNTQKIFKSFKKRNLKFKFKQFKLKQWFSKPDNLFKKFSNFLSNRLFKTENNFMNIKPIHYFNDILYTGWPFYIGFSVFFFYFFLFYH